MLHSMAIRLIHVHQLETFYLCYGVKYQSGVNFRRQTTPSPMAKCLVLSSFFLLSFFFLLATLQRLISQTCLD